jgi:hypothetical protein
MIMRHLALVALLFSPLAWGQDALYTYHSVVGQPMWIKVEARAVSFTVADVTEGSLPCSDKELVMCFFFGPLDAAIPRKEPAPGQVWEKFGTRFEEITLVPTLTWLGSTFRNVHVIRATRHGKRERFGGMTFFELYYSYESGLVGFLKATKDGETMFLSSSPTGIKSTP